MVGCGKPRKPLENKTEKVDPKASIPGAITGKGWHIPWRIRDPKNPNGPPIPVLIADAETGELTDPDNPTIVLGKVRAQLFREGKLAANIKALKVKANEQERILYGTGGCTVHSLDDVSETTITADKITWDSTSSKVVATGNTRVVRYMRKGGPPGTHTGGVITFDLDKHEFLVE